MPTTSFDKYTRTHPLSPREEVFRKLLVLLTKTIEKAQFHQRLPDPKDSRVALPLNDDTPCKFIPLEFELLCNSIGVYLHDVHTPGIPKAGIDVKTRLPIVCYCDEHVATHEAAPYVIAEHGPDDGQSEGSISPFLSNLSPLDNVSLQSFSSKSSDQHTNWSLEFGIYSTPPPASSATLSVAKTAVNHVSYIDEDGVKIVHLQRAWYTVIVGFQPGVYNGIHGVLDSIIGCGISSVYRYENHIDAQLAYETAKAEGRVMKVLVI